MKFLCANRIAPDGTPRSAASHLGLYCLPMSHKRDARLVNNCKFFTSRFCFFECLDFDFFVCLSITKVHLLFF